MPTSGASSSPGALLSPETTTAISGLSLFSNAMPMSDREHPLSGKLTVQWTIGSDGSTSGDRVVSDTLQSPAVSDCVLRAIRRVRFQAPEVGTCVVQWPFVFSPG